MIGATAGAIGDGISIALFWLVVAVTLISVGLWLTSRFR